MLTFFFTGSVPAKSAVYQDESHRGIFPASRALCQMRKKKKIFFSQGLLRKKSGFALKELICFYKEFLKKKKYLNRFRGKFSVSINGRCDVEKQTKERKEKKYLVLKISSLFSFPYNHFRFKTDSGPITCCYLKYSYLIVSGRFC